MIRAPSLDGHARKVEGRGWWPTKGAPSFREYGGTRVRLKDFPTAPRRQSHSFFRTYAPQNKYGKELLALPCSSSRMKRNSFNSHHLGTVEFHGLAIWGDWLGNTAESPRTVSPVRSTPTCDCGAGFGSHRKADLQRIRLRGRVRGEQAYEGAVF
jgi:hypothetical protein